MNRFVRILISITTLGVFVTLSQNVLAMGDAKCQRISNAIYREQQGLAACRRGGGRGFCDFIQADIANLQKALDRCKQHLSVPDLSGSPGMKPIPNLPKYHRRNSLH